MLNVLLEELRNDTNKIYELKTEDISKRVGHDSVMTTMNIYGFLYPDKQRQLADMNYFLRLRCDEWEKDMRIPRCLQRYLDALVIGNPLEYARLAPFGEMQTWVEAMDEEEDIG